MYTSVIIDATCYDVQLAYRTTGHKTSVTIFDVGQWLVNDVHCFKIRLRRDITERGRDLRGVLKLYNTFVKPVS